MSHHRTTHSRVLLAATLSFSCSAIASAATTSEAARDFLDISPERVAAFRATMADFVGGGTDDESSVDGLFMRSTYTAHQDSASLFADPYDEIASAPGLYTRDVVFEEQFLIEGREDTFRNQARRWLEREVKGSDAAAKGRESRGTKLRLKGGWSHGPVVGFGYGPMAVSASADEWRLRGGWGVGSRGWIASGWVGQEDGDSAVGFSLGRSLSRALTQR